LSRAEIEERWYDYDLRKIGAAQSNSTPLLKRFNTIQHVTIQFFDTQHINLTFQESALVWTATRFIPSLLGMNKGPEPMCDRGLWGADGTWDRVPGRGL
jgi:hypothetical protein